MSQNQPPRELPIPPNEDIPIRYVKDGCKKSQCKKQQPKKQQPKR